jgi:UDP:flavonoid glycosyltransferase YjiC (YdhE family)
MKRFLFTVLPSDDLGLMMRTLPIAGELVKRGHKVAFCTPAATPSRLIEEAGIENLFPRHPLFYLKMTGTPDLKGLYRITRSGQVKRDFGGLLHFLKKYLQTLPTRFPPGTPEVWNLDHFMALSGMQNIRLVRSLCETSVTLIREYAADVVVDSWNPLACAAAKALRKPLVTVLQADVHPESKGLIWWKERPPDVPSAVPVLNQVLAEFGLGPVEKTEELCIGDLTLVVGIPETDPLPANADATYIGPVLWQNAEAKLPGWVDDLSREKPAVWLYTGNPSYGRFASWADSAVVLELCIEALANEDVQVVLTTGHHALPGSLSRLPAHFHYEPYLPGLAMAQRSDLLIHHGGYGSCQTGLYTGTPAVIIPTFSERESNARRVAAVGAGEFVSLADRDSRSKQELASEVRSKVRRVLSESSYRTRAGEISRKMQTYGGAVYATDLIEDFSMRTQQPLKLSPDGRFQQDTG